jgi:DoxX-like family
MGCRACLNSRLHRKRVDETVCAQRQTRQAGQGWAQDFDPNSIRLIGFVEVLGAAGLILPAVTHIAPILVPLAAIGLVLVMGGAAIVHARRHEAMNIAVNVVLLALAAFLAWGRFGPYPFTA